MPALYEKVRGTFCSEGWGRHATSVRPIGSHQPAAVSTQVAEFAEDLDIILVPEMNLGQMSREIERFVDCRVQPVSKIGGVPHTIGQVLQAIREAV